MLINFEISVWDLSFIAAALLALESEFQSEDNYYGYDDALHFHMHYWCTDMCAESGL